jgi:hypothetical protein
VKYPLSSPSMQVNKHHTSDSTVFVLVQERVAYYDHRHSGIYKTNILQVIKQAEGETVILHRCRYNPAGFYSKQLQIYCSRVLVHSCKYIATGLYSTGADILQQGSTPQVQIYCSRFLLHRCRYITAGFYSRGVDLLQ